ncbi:MAG: cytidylyltransferase domain-containing protein [Alphaproteobacteria bacterium]
MARSRTVAIIQARMTSTRLPGKVMKPLAGAPLLVRFLERVRRIAGIDAICVAAPVGNAHDPIAELVAPMPDIDLVRGPEDDVLRRFALAARSMDAATVVRITSDCPLFDPKVSAAVIAAFHAADVPYARTAPKSGYPHGFDTEVIAASALADADREATDPFEREHVTPFLRRRPERFPALHIDHRPDLRHWRLTVDTEADYALACAVYDALHDSNPAFGLAEMTALFAARPDLLDLNRTST